MTMRRCSLFGIGLLVLSGGCGVFQPPFEREYLRPDGKYDFGKLKDAVDKEDDKHFGQLSWMPLARMKLVEFQQSRETSAAGRPPGYYLNDWGSYGPLFSFLHERESYYDAAGQGYEVVEEWMLLWGLWARHRSAVKTPHGTRVASRHQLLFGLISPQDEARYVPDGDG